MSKVVLITGGSSGIGKSIGEFLSNKGYIVYGTSRNPDKCRDSAFTILQLDVKNISSIEKTVETILANEGRLDVFSK
jgi:NAD(P)-dependent dehydrogenase (short-subunit alcohol dehydrogenase family)